MDHENFLAKSKPMYYPITAKLSHKRYRLIIPILVFFLSSFIFQTQLLADIRNQSADEYRIRGYEEQQKGNLDRALTYYSKAISLGLNNAIVYNDIGVVYEQLGIKDKAETYYLKAINIDSSYLPPYTNLAFFYKSQGDNENAARYFRERLERGNEDDPWQERVRRELHKIDPEYEARKVRQEAKQLSDQLVQQAHRQFSLEIERAEKHYERGKQCFNNKEYNNAIMEYDNALALTPDNPKILKARDLALFEQDIEEIKGQVRSAMEKLDAGNFEAAKKDFQEILTLIPSEHNQSQHEMPPR